MPTAEVNNDCAYGPQSEATTSVHGTFSRNCTPKIINLKSNEHPVNSLKVMETYFHDQRLTDVTLVAGTKRIPAHRLVLCAASDYFAAMFTSSLKESVQSEVELKEVDGEALLALVEYCYTGCIELREENLEALFQSARLLQLNPVVEACCQFLIRELDPGNCLGIKMFADARGCSDLSEGARRYALENFVEVITKEEYLTLPRQEVARLLESDDLNVPSEETVFYALTTWIRHDSRNRSKDASDLLSYIRLPLLSPAFIFANIENNELFGSQATVLALIIEALKYHLSPDCKELLRSDRVKPRKNDVPILLAIGGNDDSGDHSQSIEAFSSHVNAWQDLTSMRNRGSSFGAAVLDEKLVVGGGRIEKKCTDVVECYDFFNKSWDTLSRMKKPRQSLGFAVLRGSLYAVGGFDGLTVLKTVERWDQTADRWNYVAPLRTARSGMGVAVLNNKLYAVGGWNGQYGSNTMERYDTYTNEWTFCTPMSKRRRSVSVGVLNELLYVLGGLENLDLLGLLCLDSVERYNPKTDTWTMVARLSSPRYNVGACALGGRLFAVGGISTNKQYVNMVEEYDPDRDEWQKVAPLTVGRAGPCVVVNVSNFRT